jgi:sigma-B regulation protein RsbU (phosphoserine phosphatase)
MNPRAILPLLGRFFSEQLVYLAIALATHAIFLAIDPANANLISSLVYSFCLGNLVTLMQEHLSFLYTKRGYWNSWVIYLLVLSALTPAMVTFSTVLVFWVQGSPGPSFWWYLGTSWKFPSVGTVIFGIVSQLYRDTKCRLERRNRELQHAVESEIAQREFQEQELQRAREIQQSLLPKQVPQIAGFEIAGSWEPARIVGGDYFDVIRLGESKLAICIADVVGKSISAALLMANVQATVRAFASESASPSWLCTRVNSVLCENIASGKFVTLFYGVLDAKQKTLQYTSAGHPHPILTNASGSVRLLDNGGAVLGVFPSWKYEDSVVQLTPGDRLVLYTDGITEAAKADGEEFGEERLIHLLKALADESPSDLNAHLLTDVKKFCDSHLQDDATLISIAVFAASIGKIGE